MKNMKKIAALSLAAALSVTTFTACGGKTAESEAPANSDAPAASQAADKAPSNALEQIKADGVLTVATAPDFSPMEFVDSSKSGQDQYVGFDVTLAKYIAEELGVKCEIQAMGFDACQTAVYTGAVPISISGYSWTEARAENYELSDYYYAGDNETKQVLLVRKADADKYKSAADFDGKDVGAQNASLQMQLVTDQLPNANAKTMSDITVGVMELQSGNIEALAVADGNGTQIIANNPDLVKCEWEFKVDEAYEANVIMIKKGETELLDAVNAALKKAYDGGMYNSWYEEALAIAAKESAIEVEVEDTPTASPAA